MITDRRKFLGGAAAAAIGSQLTAMPIGGGGLPETLQGLADAMLATSPEARAYLGLDSGIHAGAKSRLDSRSPARFAHDVAVLRDYHRRLAAIDRSALRPADRIQIDSMMTALDYGISGSVFAFGDNSLNAVWWESARPYVITQSAAAVFDVPQLLDTVHGIATTADAEAYLARLAMLGPVMDQETARLRTDTANGVIAPDFILDNAITQMAAIRSIPAAQQKMVLSITKRARALQLPGDWSERAEASVTSSVLPALDRQLGALRQARSLANGKAGIWKLKEGEAYYNWLLTVGTTTRLNAEEIHRTGLEQDRELESRMNEVLRSLGLSQGTVSDRMQAIARDPKNLFADTDAGREELLGYLNNLISTTRPRLARLSKFKLKAGVVVKRVPVELESGAAQGSMNAGSLDGSRTSIYYIDLKSMANWPRYQLPTLTAHEAIPGHVWANAYASEHHSEVPLVKSLVSFNGFDEGWALYAEQLNDELGAYADDPLAKLGYLQAQRLRAGRLVVDTGIHAKQWTRNQAIEWLVASTGRARDGITSEIDRYCAKPGQACGYKVGQNEILRLRAKAQARLGDRFDLRDFNDTVVATTGVPLTVLETAVDAYIAKIIQTT